MIPFIHLYYTLPKRMHFYLYATLIDCRLAKKERCVLGSGKRVVLNKDKVERAIQEVQTTSLKGWREENTERFQPPWIMLSLKPTELK